MKKSKSNRKYKFNFRKKTDVQILYFDGSRYTIKDINALLISSEENSVFIEECDSLVEAGIFNTLLHKIRLSIVQKVILKTPEGKVEILNTNFERILVTNGSISCKSDSFVYKKVS